MASREFLVPAENCDEDFGSHRFIPAVDYFAVKVLEMRLAKSKGWFTGRNPMLYVRTGFSYAGAHRQLPFVIGPPAPDERGAPAPLPADLVIRDITAAGWHPYRGRGLSMLVVLYSVPDDAQLTSLLAVVDKLVSAVKVVPGLGPYLAVVDAVQGGVAAIGGLRGTTPVLGWQREFDLNSLVPGMWVIAGRELEPSATYVRGRRLEYHGDGAGLDGADYVLLSIERNDTVPDAGDLPGISFLRELVNRYAGIRGEDSWELARAHLASLAQALLDSPDLTEAHAKELIQVYRRGADDRRAQILAATARGPVGATELDGGARQALAVLRGEATDV
jgi:hypothetical protein